MVLGSSVINFSGHDHPLYLCDGRTILPVPCSWCGTRSNDPPNFRCKDCMFKLDLLCGPLPVAIQTKQKGMDLTLTLEDSYVPGSDLEDCWCDICEKQRDPAHCVYRSDEPPFVASIDCLWTQIKLALEGVLGEVELRTVGRGQIPGKVMAPHSETEQRQGQDRCKQEAAANATKKAVIATWNLEHILKSLSNEEQWLVDSLDRENGYEDKSDEGMEADPFYTEEALKTLKEQLQLGSTGPVDTSAIFGQWREEEYSEVQEGVIVPSRHIALYWELFDRYGDFSAGSKLTPWGKALFFALFLHLVSRMRKIRVFEAARYGHLQRWRSSLKRIQDVAGFDMEAALDKFDNELVRACFGCKAKDYKEDKDWQMEKLSREIKEEAAKLDALRAEEAQYKKTKMNEESVLKQCLKEAWSCKWRKVGQLF